MIIESVTEAECLFAEPRAVIVRGPAGDKRCETLDEALDWLKQAAAEPEPEPEPEAAAAVEPEAEPEPEAEALF